jgi:CHAT domain
MSALEARLRQFEANPEPGMVLDPAAQAEAAELLESAVGLRADTQVLKLVGALHLLRWTASQNEEAGRENHGDQEELLAAMALFAPLLDRRRRLLPRLVRRFLARQRRQKPRPDEEPAGAALRGFLTAKRPAPDAWAELLWQLSLVLYHRYERVNQVPALSEAIAVLRHAVLETPRDDPGYPGRATRLGAWLLVLHKETSRSATLDEALTMLRIAPGPPDGNQRLALLSARGSALHALFGADNDLDALSAAVRAHRDALGSLSTDDPRYGHLALRLAAALLRHYERTRQLPSLDEAIEKLRASHAAATGQRAPVMFAALSNNLSVALIERYERTKDKQDLDEAIAAGESAVGSAESTDDLASAHGTLGMALLARYIREASPDPAVKTVLDNRLHRILEHLRTAVTLTSDDSPGHATALANLGTGLLRARAVGAPPEILDEASDAFGVAADSQGAAPPVRARASLTAGRLAADRRDWHVAAGRLTAAIDLLEAAVPRGLLREDREYQLSQLRDLGSDAAACAWRDGDTERAVALFERGRGVLLAQEMGTGTELERLREQGSAHNANLAERFSVLRLEMERAGSGGLVSDVSDWTGRTAAEQRRDLLKEWDDLLAQIRDVPGFEDFLRPPQQAALLGSGSEGPVALVNVSKYGSAAFLIRDHSVIDVELPGLTPATVRAMVAELLTVTSLRDARDIAERIALEPRLEHLLGLLWDTVTGPVLDRLGMTARLDPEAAEPRIWWCPSGLLSFLPLHAAGHHATRADACPQTVIDRVISSYIPTIATLEHARRAPARPAESMLIVAPGNAGTGGLMTEPTAPGEQADATVLLAGAAATRDAVLSALPAHGRVHFACHGASDLNDPSTGFLELYGQEHLAVATVAALRLGNAEFAFLAACSTYQGGTTLADEAIHLGGAFRLAGYQHVVATLWPIKDSLTAGEITRAVHQGIAGPAGTAATAACLHKATRQQRDRVSRAPSLWAPYVHSGS